MPLDIGLPRLDAYEVAPAFAGTRLHALAGYGREQDHRRSREVDINRHRTKPIDLAELRELAGGAALMPGGRSGCRQIGSVVIQSNL